MGVGRVVAGVQMNKFRYATVAVVAVLLAMAVFLVTAVFSTGSGGDALDPSELRTEAAQLQLSPGTGRVVGMTVSKGECVSGLRSPTHLDLAIETSSYESFAGPFLELARQNGWTNLDSGVSQHYEKAVKNKTATLAVENHSDARVTVVISTKASYPLC
jgi:hypothetical protein